MILETPALDVSVSPDGSRLLYDNRPMYENEWRKGAVSDGTRDIWLYDLSSKTHRQLTDWRGEDRDAFWTKDAKGFYFLSERSGSFNVWEQPLDGAAKPVQVSFHEGQPVRFLSVANDGSIVYGFAGDIWRKAAGSRESQRVPVRISQGSLVQGAFSANANEYASELSVSADGSEIALIARGEVFVVSMKNGLTRRITSTPQFERSVSFSPDGRALLYVSDREGDSDIFEARIPGNRPPSFVAPGTIEESKLIDTEGDALFPTYSPDGKRVAFLDNRESIKVYNREDRSTVAPLPKGSIYSYADGDMTLAWSPDGRWLTATTGSIVTAPEVVLLDAGGKNAPINISRSGYRDTTPQFTADSQAIIWWSDRNGLRQADANAAEFDFYIAHLTHEAYDRFLHPANVSAPPTDSSPWQPEAKSIAYRTARLTPYSILPVFSRVTADNQHLLFVALELPGRAVGYRLNLQTHGLEQLFAKPLTTTTFASDASGQNLYALTPNGIERISTAGGASVTIPFRADIDYDPHGEVAYLFDYFWRITKLKFYQSNMHGRDWDAPKKTYAQYLPHIHQWEDFADLMGEMAGHLNASHMGCFYTPSPKLADETASLAVYEDPAYQGDGLRVAEVLAGGPCDGANSVVQPGVIIMAVDGQPITSDMSIDRLLNRKVSIPVELTVRPRSGAEPVKQIVTPVSMDAARQLSVERWIAQRKKMTEELSGGKVGYVYISAMDANNYQRTFGELFGELADKDAVVIDVRFNRGGNLHDQLISLFTGDVFAGFVNRDGQVVGRMPVNRWAKPSALLANAGSYSDGSIFPHLYQRQKIGPVVGARVPGTGTSVWWMTVRNEHIKYGIPQLGAKDFQSGWFENQETVPDLLVFNDPDAIEEGRDPQLQAAVKQLLTNLHK